jgi:uncharacterized protein (TIGR03067 family)
MKPVRNTLIVGLIALIFSPIWAAEPDAAKAELTQMQGEWSMVSGSADGQAMPTELLKQMKRVCTGDEVTTKMGARVYFKAKITLDPTKTPKTIDYEMTEGVTKGKTQLGIYEVDGATFKSSFSAPGDARPTDFTSKAGDRRTVTVWKREHPAPSLEEKTK